MTSTNTHIVLTAGGSGGHVFPAEALAKELTQRNVEISFITDRRGNSFSGKFPEAKEYRIYAGAYAGKPLIKKLFALFLMGSGLIQSLLILHKIKPAAVVGFGGYAAFPASFAAGLLKIPLILHEQNSVLGGANRMLAKRATLIATTFPRVERIPAGIPSAYTGVPVRPEISAVRDTPYQTSTNTFNLLIFGGSQGASIFSHVIPDALKALPDDLKKRLNIAQQCRAADLPDVRKTYENSGLSPELAPFFSDMADRLTRAHLVICRAGASSLAELCIAGRPSLIVPILCSPDAHQLKNARFIAENNGAILCEEPDFTPDYLTAEITKVMNDPSVLAEAARRAKELGRPDAVRRFADAVLNTAKKGA
ncbi:MAG: undecaprenyldiphospho-muramoylpentapeptide beta-N-acetylglucosaminyltransferase [Alphaproteobacteria bacterium]|nr:undecaprenyldiphospho-muramoylpentapeptide beta-N-acetylglucosaminyltransferase [Alphaproteobacteria bacterium]